MANLNKVMKHDILEYSKSRANDLLQQYARLRILYSEQDGLIGMGMGIQDLLYNFYEHSVIFMCE